MRELTERLVKHFTSEFKQQNVEDLGPKIFFVRQRSQKLIELHPDWSEEKLKDRLKAEIKKIDVWLGAKVGSHPYYGPIITGEHDHTPIHIDLNQLTTAQYRTKAFQIVRLAILRLNRSLWAYEIVWRAFALHPELWWESKDEYDSLALNEVVDRRLHIVERMVHNVNGGEIDRWKRKWEVSSAKGPWKDEQKFRIFEYPWLPKEYFKPYLSQMKKDGWKDTGTDLIFDDNGVKFRVAPSVISEFVASKDTESGYRVPKLKPNKYTPAEIFEKMFTPSDDFWLRNWFFCDQVAAAVSVEALRFALKRRESSDATFNAGMKKDYVYLTGVLSGHGPADAGILMADMADPFFENTEIHINELQVGDELIFWNHPLYQIMAPTGGWRNEYSFVVNVENDINTGEVSISKLLLTGHGVKTTSYAGMAKKLADFLKDGFNFMYASIQQELEIDKDKDKLLSGAEPWAIKWPPYGESFDPPGAWWLVLPKTVWNGIWGYSSAVEAVSGVPRTVMRDKNPGKGYIAPPVDDDTILFPLFEPAFGEKNLDSDSWNAYLTHRKSSDKAAPKKLRPITVDGLLTPGLYYRGKKYKIPVIRPKVRKK